MKIKLLITLLFLGILSNSYGQSNLYLGPYTGSTGVIGRLSVSGGSAEVSLLNRKVNAYVEIPTLGERWVLYNDGTATDGRLRFWSGGDKASLTKEGAFYLGAVTSTAAAPGRFSLSGTSGELSLNNRSISYFVEAPTLGERWVIYNQGTATDGKLRFWSGGDKLVLTKEGRVGIGTSNPDDQLTVNGKIHAQEVKVDLSIPAPDYVFEDTYDLMPLTQVKEYITANKHLPEIPSAADMKQQGVDLGDMNMKLLKKIEELTLYQIELLKRIESLEQKDKARQSPVKDVLEK
jgi:hypothetical protein